MALAPAAAKARAWLTIIRLPFHPMAFVAYSMGTAAAFRQSGGFSPRVFWLGYALVFAIELATIFTNEYFDYETDRLNTNSSPFTGGTRVLVEGRLGFPDVRSGILALLVLVVVLAYLVSRAAVGVPPLTVFIYVAVGLFFGLGYTAPPLKFCYRGAGELVVGATHSFYVVVAGYLFQTGKWAAPFPWGLTSVRWAAPGRAARFTGRTLLVLVWRARAAASATGYLALPGSLAPRVHR